MTNHSNKSRLITLAVLGLAGLLIVLERCHTYSEPLERDITTYAVIGQELLKGRSLYSDLWDHKPPAIHLTYAFAEAVAGEGPLAVFLLNILCALATLAALYQGGKALGGRAGGLWAAIIWAVVSGDLYLQANQPNEEAFLNVFQTWVFVLWLSASAKTLEPRRWVFLGVLAAAASLYKPFAVLEVLLLGAVYLVLIPKAFLRKTALGQVGIALACVLTAWVALFSWFFLQQRGEDFIEAVFFYNFSYGIAFTYWFGEFLHILAGMALDFSTLACLLLLFAVGCLGALLGKKKKEERGPWLFWGAFLVAAELEILLPGRFFAHYDQLLLPPLALGAAWGVQRLGEAMGKKRKQWKWVPGALLLTLLVFHEAPFYGFSPEEWVDKKYSDGPLFIQSYQLGRELDGILQPGETFYEWGNESELYFAARRSPPSGVFYSYPLLGSFLAGKLSFRVLGDLQKARPEAVVVNTSYYLSEDLKQRESVLRWVRDLYQPFPINAYREPFLLMMLKGGNLEKRLTAAGVSPPPGSKP